jgi:hypothetical protein
MNKPATNNTADEEVLDQLAGVVEELKRPAALLRRLATDKGREAWLAEQKRALGEGAASAIAAILNVDYPDAVDLSRAEKNETAACCASDAWDQAAEEASVALAEPQPSIWDNWFVHHIGVLAKIELVTGEEQDSEFLLEAYAAKARELIDNPALLEATI